MKMSHLIAIVFLLTVSIPSFAKISLQCPGSYESNSWGRGVFVSASIDYIGVAYCSYMARDGRIYLGLDPKQVPDPHAGPYVPVPHPEWKRAGEEPPSFVCRAPNYFCAFRKK